MPNFVAKYVDLPPLNYEKNGVKFGFVANNKFDTLIETDVENIKFFITLKKRKDSFVLKADKATKPTYTGLLQRALTLFKDDFCKEILSDATTIKPGKIKKNSLITTQDEFLERIKSSNFDQIYIEIGFGSGRHFIYQAEKNPNVLLFGIEIYIPSILQVCNLAKSKNLHNILLLNADARAILELLESASVDKIFMHFPVPWDKSEHRRVVSQNFATEIQRVLKQDGEFELRSDDFEYINFSISHFLALPHSKMVLYSDRNLDVSSKYEDRWKKQNKTIFDMVFKNLVKSQMKKTNFDMKFDRIYNPENVMKNFSNKTIKNDECFLHLQSCYKISSEEILIKISFGAFYRPENSFVYLSKEKCQYYPKQPFGLRANYMAHLLLKEFLNDASNDN